MATKPKNKTSLRVGQTVWSDIGTEYEVTKIEVLSNKVLYFEAKVKDTMNEYIIECVIENSKGSTDARPLSYASRDIFIEEKRAKDVYRQERDREECYYLGYNLKNIARTLKHIRL